MPTLEDYGFDQYLNLSSGSDTPFYSQDPVTLTSNYLFDDCIAAPLLGGDEGDTTSALPMTGLFTLGDQESPGRINLVAAPTKGDCYIASGKSDYTNTDAGFILGIDDSDSDKVKFYIGDSSYYLNWTGATLTIKGVINATSGTLGGFYLTANDIYAGDASIASANTTIVMGNLDGTSKIALGASADSITIDGTETGFIADGSGEFRVGNATDFVMFRTGTGEGFSFKGTNTELTEGGLLDVSNIDADGGIIGGFYLAATTLGDNAVTTSSDILLDSANRLIRVGDTGSDYLKLAVVEIAGTDTPLLESSNYVSGATGSGFHIDTSYAEFGDIRARGKFTTLVMEYEAVSAIGGNLLISKNADILDADMTALDAGTLTITGKVQFEVGDMLQAKDGIEEEWFEVTNVDSAPTYTVTRDKKSSYAADANPAWQKGVAIVNYGASGDGGILLTASSINSPRMDVFTHTGSPWSALTTRLRVGNLNGYLGLTDDVYGFGVGDTSDYLRVYHDGTNLQFKLALTSSNSLAEIEIGTDGYIRGGQTAYNTGTGWWIGHDAGMYKVSIGDSSQFLTYADTELSYKGALEAVYPIQLKTYAFASLPDPIVDTGDNSPTGTAS